MKTQEAFDLFNSTATRSRPKHNLDTKQDESVNFPLELLCIKISGRSFSAPRLGLPGRLHHAARHIYITLIAIAQILLYGEGHKPHTDARGCKDKPVNPYEP